MKKLYVLIMICSILAVSQAVMVDDFSDTDLSEYTLSVVLEQSGTNAVSFASPSGTLQVSKAADSGAEQVVFLRGDVNLGIGDILRVDTAGADTSSYADFGIAVSKTADPPDAVWTSGTADARDGYLAIYLKPLYDSIGWAGYDGGNIGSSSGAGVTWADLTGLFIARTASNEYQGGYSTAGGDTVLVTWTPTSDMSVAGGFYADVRAETTYGDLDNLEIISTLTPLTIVSDPNDLTLVQTENATFETVFTSDSTPTGAWYKVDASGDIYMDPLESNIDVELTYESASEQYTSTLSISGLTIADSGQYYCQVINDSGIPANSAPANLMVLGLAAHWTLDSDRSGDVDPNYFYLEEVAGYDALVNGTPTFVTGADGTANHAIQITAGQGWALCPVLDPIKQSGQLTISFWANWSETPPTRQDLLAESTLAQLVDPNGLKADNHWQHICTVYDGSTGKLYVDGVLRDQGPWQLPGQTDAAINIGIDSDQQNPFNGALDDVRIYNYALTAPEVAAIHDAWNCLLEYDFTGPDGLTDCTVDLYDLNYFAAQWLILYDMADFAGFAAEWLLSDP